MFSLDFQNDGKIRVYAATGETSISVTCAANELQNMLPGTVFDAMTGRVEQLFEILIQQRRKPRLVGRS